MFEFIVERTSIFGQNARPCKEATHKTITVNCYGKERQENVWVVNFVGMKDLLDFKKKYGQVIIKSYIWDGNLQVIEIYDDYRE